MTSQGREQAIADAVNANEQNLDRLERHLLTMA
jgi:hypothetical protein